MHRPPRSGVVPLVLDVTWVFTVLVGGALLGLAWRVVVPFVQEWSDPAEAGVAADGTMAVFEVLAGLVTGCVLLRWPGRSRLRRFLLTAAATVGAGWVAVATAWVLVDWTPAAPGVAMVWPVSAVATVFLGSCLAMALWPVPRAEVLPPGRGEVLPSGDPGPRP
ncbi:MAG: hypothetical protein GXX79_21485 [Actinomycetales bacterium]|nr:hypothetical protein [Actinomycetales bacterium]